MANEDEQKLLFRMQYIIPRGLAASSTVSHNSDTETSSSPKEIEIQMTWGKVAGGIWNWCNAKFERY